MSRGAGRAVRERLDDILDAVERTKRAEARLVRAEANGDTDGARVALDAILYNLVVIGEAVNALPIEITDAEPAVPWRDVVDMRNFLSHEYFRVHTEVVRRTIDEPLEQLGSACTRLLAIV
ncbi:MAG TPA: HepT-like ribonuclease domain-containing protein [Actinokineospora sp.]|nr:HepT-like ribonuclease domain-containing protein [Actinokineospora sp.]